MENTKQSVNLDFKDYQKLSKKLASQFMRQVGKRGYRVSYDDAYSEVCMCWVKARDGFDETKGFTFSTYFMRSVVYQVRNYILKLKEQKNERGAVWLDEVFASGTHWFEQKHTGHDVIADVSNRSQETNLMLKEASWLIKGRTPLLGKFLDLTASDHDELQAELDAAQAQRDYAESMGIQVCIPNALTPKVLADVFRLDWKQKQRVRDELEGALKYV